MKILRRLLLLLLALFAVWATVTYPRIGALVYEDGGHLEARLYGLHERFADIDGVHMAYYIGGPADAPTLVMLHGYSADKQVWPRFARHFLDHYRVVIPDLAGHGESSYSPAWNYGAPAQAKRVADLLEHLGIGPVHIIGNSMGGFIAAHFALAYPQRTLSLALVDAAGVKSPQPSDLEKMLQAGHNPFIVHSRGEFDSFYAMTMSQPPYLPGFVLAAIAQRYESSQDRLAKIFADFHDRDLLDDRLASITAPTLVLWGRYDRLIDVSTADVWAAGLPHSHKVILDGVGHMPMVERPAESAAVYRDFLQELGTGPAAAAP